MLRILERVMGIPSWEHDLFHENVVYAVVFSEPKSTGQRSQSPEADDSDIMVDMDLVSQETWNWCIAEFQDKARDLRKHNFALSLYADSGVCKSDRPVGELLRIELQEVFKKLPPPCDRRGVFSEKDDLSPVYDLVKLSLFMLSYGQTAVLNHGAFPWPTEV